MLDRIRDLIVQHGMLTAGDTVLAAVSGGVDSMVLLHVLAALRPCLGLRLRAAHLDHGLRGPEGAREAAVVAAWAAALDVPASLERLDRLDPRGGSLQRAARVARYAFLERVADRFGASRIAVGHNQDDVAETVLLNLTRGAGLRGLAAIPPVRGRIIRPLYGVSREAILAYARAHQVLWVEDASNRAPIYRRNRVRAELIPALATFNPRIRETLARTASILRAEEDFLGGLAQEALRPLLRPRAAAEVGLSGAGLAHLAPALRRRVLRAAAESLPGRPILAARHAAALEAWAAAGPRAGRCGFLCRVDAWWDGQDLVLAPKAFVPSLDLVPLPLGVPTRVATFRTTFLAEAADVQPEGPPRSAPGEAWIDAAAAADGLAVRGWRFGDRFRPLGMAGTKKLQDLFVDGKVPRARRGRIPLVVSGDRILWVVGHRIDAGARLTPATRRILRLTARPDPVAAGD